MYDPYMFPFSSRRALVYAQRGMVATTHPVAAEAGLRILRAGGNAVDAAVATAAALTVVEPASNGIGGDNFAIVSHGGRMYGMNSSGYLPGALSLEKLLAKGYTEMPDVGWDSVTVPGAPSGWAALSERFGKLPFAKLLEPAIEIADEGHALQADAVSNWERAGRRYAKELGELSKPWHEVFTRRGEAYRPGDIFRSPQHARALRAIAETKAEAFYRGAIAEAIVAHAGATGGHLTMEDLAGFRTLWVDPVSVRYRDHEVWELPPNGQGIVALMALNILSGYDFPREGFGGVETLHRQLEAIKLAFADARAYLADPGSMTVSVEALLSKEFAAQRRAEIAAEARDPHPGTPPSGGTVYLAAADKDSMISMIQSNFKGFGSGLVVPGWGISLHSRGLGFTLKEGHPNAPAPGKRPYHTIIPGFLTKDGAPVGPFGVMGAYMQPQGHMQVVMNTLDFGMNPQAALDAPRFFWKQGLEVDVEPGHNLAVLSALERRGHALRLASSPLSSLYGRGQIIWRTPQGTLCGGTEPRADGGIYAY